MLDESFGDPNTPILYNTTTCDEDDKCSVEGYTEGGVECGPHLLEIACGGKSRNVFDNIYTIGVIMCTV